MKVLIAGATGAIGRPLVQHLRANQHEVFALTRSPESASTPNAIGAEVILADVLDGPAVKAALGRIRPDAVINELTSLPRHYTRAEMKAAAARDRRVRLEGNANLLASLRDAGVRRYLLQSAAFWYAPGVGLADETVPFISTGSPAVEASVGTYQELEARASAAAGIELVALRYGFFYGPSTWYTREGDLVIRCGNDRFRLSVRARASTISCISTMRPQRPLPHWRAPPGAYSIVDGNPSPQHVWLTAFARAAGAPPPPRVSEEEALRTLGQDAVYYATKLRGASNDKARREFDFRPRPLEWILVGTDEPTS